jgi:hypothetical protein
MRSLMSSTALRNAALSVADSVNVAGGDDVALGAVG